MTAKTNTKTDKKMAVIHKSTHKQAAAGAALLCGAAAALAQQVPGQDQGPPAEQAGPVARGFRYDAGVAARETWTDNVLLGGPGDAKSGFITEVIPRIRLSENAARLRGDLSYSPDVLFYGKYGTQTRHQLNAGATGELVPDLFYLDGLAIITQQRGSALGPASTESPAQNGNRLETRTLGLDPYIRGATSGGDTFFLRNNNAWTTTSNSELPRTRLQDWIGHYESPAQRTVSWAGDAEDHRTSFTNEPTLDYQLARLKPRYHPDPDVLLYASGGYEHNNFLERRSNPTYGGGVEWRPSRRTTAAARWEHRFFGSSYMVSGQHRAGGFVVTADIGRDTTTFGQQTILPPLGDTAALLDDALAPVIANPDQRYNNVNQDMRNANLPTTTVPTQLYFAQGLYVSRREDASIAYVMRALTTALTVYQARNRSLVDSGSLNLPNVFVVGDRTTSSGVGLTVAYRLTRETNVTLIGAKTLIKSEVPLVTHSNQAIARLQVTHVIGPSTNFSWGARYTHFTTESSDFTGFTERMVFIGIDQKLF